MGPLKYQIPLILFAVVASFFYLRTSRTSMDPSTSSAQLRKIAVTGSNGSVGQRVVLSALQRGYHVVGIDHSALVTADGRDLGSNFSFLQADLRDYNETLKAFRLPGSIVATVSNCRSFRHLTAAKRSFIWPLTANPSTTKF